MFFDAALKRFHLISESYFSESYSSYFKTHDSNNIVSQIYVELQVWLDRFLIQDFGRILVGSILLGFEPKPHFQVKSMFEPHFQTLTLFKNA